MGEVHRPPAGGVGLASERLAFGPATLQTIIHDHLALRTPTRPDHWSGNAVHLFEPPADLEAAFRRFDRSIGHLPGLTRRVVAWEATDGSDTPGVDVPDGTELHVVEHGVLGPDTVSSAPVVPDEVTLVRAETPEHWAGAKVLYLQTDWGESEPYWRWHTDQQRQLVEGGSALVLVAYQIGIPVGRAGVFLPHDGAAGVGDRLAVVEDVVVHPLYRRRGIGTALVLALADVARRLLPEVRVVIGSDPGTPTAAWYARLGFEPTSWSWKAVRPVA